MDYLAIHQKTLDCAKRYQRCEAELIDCLQLVKRDSVHLKLGYPSLHVYAVKGLGFTDDQAYHFTRVAMKALEIPEIGQAIAEGTLSVSKARRVLSVITRQNQAEWIDKAIQLPQRELEREVVKVHPKAMVRDKLRPLAQSLSELHCTIPVEVEALIRRVQDLESRRQGKSVDIAAALRAGLELYLDKNDPLRKAARQRGQTVDNPTVKKVVLRQGGASNSIVTTRQYSSAKPTSEVTHAVNLRDEARCRYRNTSGERCGNSRFTEIHHIKPRFQGGPHTFGNLITLCSAHHRFLHRQGGLTVSWPSRKVPFWRKSPSRFLHLDSQSVAL